MFCPKCGTQNPDSGRFCRSCGTHLQQVSQVLNNSADLNRKSESQRLKHVEALGKGTREIITGIGFLIFAVILYNTNLWGGQFWWWAMLFPAFGSLAKGISEMVKYRAFKAERKIILEKSNTAGAHLANPQNQKLPPLQSEYISPQKTKFDTGELQPMPPSVTEDTTRHLQIDSENETMTLPKKQ